MVNAVLAVFNERLCISQLVLFNPLDIKDVYIVQKAYRLVLKLTFSQLFATRKILSFLRDLLDLVRPSAQLLIVRAEEPVMRPPA